MLKIGLTGGIGSGKTTIANIFSTLGIPVYDADGAAKRLMHTDATIRQQLTAYFGPEIYKDGQLNRIFLSSLVFNNEQKLKELNAITHPVTIRDSENWFLKQQQAPYAIKEAALIFESGSQAHLDYVIGVWAEKNLRIQRVLQRGGLSPEAIEARMQKQMDETEKMNRCDFVIDNNEQVSVIAQVYDLHQQLIALSKDKSVVIPS